MLKRSLYLIPLVLSLMSCGADLQAKNELAEQSVDALAKSFAISMVEKSDIGLANQSVTRVTDKFLKLMNVKINQSILISQNIPENLLTRCVTPFSSRQLRFYAVPVDDFRKIETLNAMKT